MQFIICSVFDRQSRQYSAPFTSFTQDTAVRDFVRAVRDSKGHTDKFPQDYELFKLGRFDSETGICEMEKPEFLAAGANYCEE